MVDRALRMIVSQEKWQEVLIRAQHNSLVDVYLNNDERMFANRFNHKFIIQFKPDMSKLEPLILLFPNHPDERKRVLYTEKYSAFYKLGKEINDRLNASLNGDTVKLCIVYGNKFYRVRDTYGNAYLCWAERINKETLGRQQNQIAENVPVFVETSGKGDIRSMIPFMEDFIDNTQGKLQMFPIEMRNVSVIMPIDTVLFPCEVDTRKDALHSISTITKNKADLLTKDIAVRRLVNGFKEEEAPFALETTTEDSIVVGSSDLEIEELQMELATPRVKL